MSTPADNSPLPREEEEPAHPSIEPSGGAPAGPPRKKQRPSKSLPTDRVGFQKQADSLNGYASIYEATKAPVTNEEVGKLVKLNATTAALMNSFFVDTGLLQKMEGGFIPSEEVKAYARARQWEEANAGHKLKPLLADTWFAQTLLPHLRVAPKEEKEALALLALAVNAEPSYRPHLTTLLDFLELAGLIEREGGIVKATRPEREPPPPPLEKPATKPEEVRPTAPPATARTVELASGGTLTISATLDPFALSPADRGFVFKLIDELLHYEEGKKEVRDDKPS